MRRLLTAIVIMLGSTLAYAETATIDFEDTAPEYGPSFYAPYESQGFTITPSSAIYGKITTAPAVPSGKAILIGPYGFTFWLSGASFSLQSFDSGFFGDPALGRVQLTGYRDNVVVISETLVGIGSFMETLTVGSGWINLDTVRFDVSHADRQAGAIDNIVVGVDGILVEMDVVPNDSSNYVNTSGSYSDKMYVSIEGSAYFDATQVDSATVRFGPAGASPFVIPGSIVDSNQDGYSDMKLKFRIADTGLTCDNIDDVTITGDTNGGLIHFEASDSVTTDACVESCHP